MEKHIDIEKDVVSFQQAIDLCMIGFNEKTLCAYEIENQELYLCHLDEEGLYMPEKDMPAPLRSQVFRWFREKYDIQGYIYSSTVRGNAEKTKQFTGYIWNINGIDMAFLSTDTRDELHDTYEEAESACIDKLISLCKQQGK